MGNIDVIGKGIGLKHHSVAVSNTRKAHFDSVVTLSPNTKGDKTIGVKISDKFGA